MMIDLVQLRTFVAVAEEQHLTRASERLHISLSAASTHVRAIEETLGTQLFARTNRNLELTRAGQLLFGRAKALLNEASQFTSFARELQGKIEGQLVVGSDNEPGDSRIGRIAAAVMSRHPLIQVDLRARPTASTKQGLKTGELDLGLMLEDPADPGLTYHQLTTVQFHVAGPAAWKEKLDAADWAELARLPWLAPGSGSPSYAQMLREMFEKRGLELDVVARFDNPVLGRALLEAGVGLMLVRQAHALRGVAEGALAISSMARAAFPLFLAHMTNRCDDPLIRAFLDAAQEVWPGMKAATAASHS
ncbi:MAG TPA: LysR family transcriptional regulator [Ramlibacter sp.]|nr:LysR family transcriptional regulator [Ramlibacter sp.]